MGRYVAIPVTFTPTVPDQCSHPESSLFYFRVRDLLFHLELRFPIQCVPEIEMPFFGLQQGPGFHANWLETRAPKLVSKYSIEANPLHANERSSLNGDTKLLREVGSSDNAGDVVRIWMGQQAIRIGGGAS